jgi:hypothetical protein
MHSVCRIYTFSVLKQVVLDVTIILNLYFNSTNERLHTLYSDNRAIKSSNNRWWWRVAHNGTFESQSMK